MIARLRRSPVLTAHLLLLAVVLIWGTTFTLVKTALANVSPLLFNLCRMLLATVVLGVISWRQLRSTTKFDLAAGSLAGLFLGLGYQFQTAGLARTTPTKSAFITGLVVVLVPLLSALPGARSPGMPATQWNGFAGAALAFVGLALLTIPANGDSIWSSIGEGELLTLLCALAFAGHLITLARISARMDARRLGVLQIAAASAVMLVTLPLEAHSHVSWSASVIVALLVTGVLATAAAFTIQSWAQKHISATNAALIFTLEPVFAWATSLLILNERLSTRSVEGAVLILGGILLSELWPKKNIPQPGSPTNPLIP